MGEDFVPDITYYCASQLHKFCTVPKCRCECHNEGGVREPRRPIPDEGGGKEMKVMT